MNKFSYLSLGLSCLCLALLSSVFLLAEDGSAAGKGKKFYAAGKNKWSEVYEHNYCFKVYNGTFGSNLMVPANTRGELDVFVSKRPGGVSVSQCNLYGGKTFGQCTGGGGVIVQSGSHYFCRFNRSSCPGGWNQYGNWSTTTVKSCGNCSARNTGSHGWSNRARESVVGYNGTSGDECGGGVTCWSNITQIGCY